MKKPQRELQDWQKRFVCRVPIDRKVSVVTAKGQFNQPDLNVIGQFEISFRLVHYNEPFTLDDVLPKIAKAIRDGVKGQYKLVKKKEIVDKKKSSKPSGYGGGEGLHDRPW
jgi:hypothetical protein